MVVNAKGYAVAGCFLMLVGIIEVLRGNIALVALAFFLATACALRAHSKWKREKA